MDTKSKRKHKSRLPHISIASIVIVVVLLAILVYLVHSKNSAFAGEAIQIKNILPPPGKTTISVDVLNSVVLQSELELKVKEIIKNSLTFKAAEAGLSCQQVCQQAPAPYLVEAAKRYTSACVGIISATYLASGSGIVLLHAPNQDYDAQNKIAPACQAPMAVNEADSTLCLCI